MTEHDCVLGARYAIEQLVRLKRMTAESAGRIEPRMGNGISPFSLPHPMVWLLIFQSVRSVYAWPRGRRHAKLHARGRLGTSKCFAYNLQFLAELATPEPIKDWSLTSLKDKLIKIGAKVVSRGRYVAFQMAEVAIPRQMFQEILRLIAELRPQPPRASMKRLIVTRFSAIDRRNASRCQ